jgi:hypothetical protein
MYRLYGDVRVTPSPRLIKTSGDGGKIGERLARGPKRTAP